MNFFLLWIEARRGVAADVEQMDEGRASRPYRTVLSVRGGGDSGSMERGISTDRTCRAERETKLEENAVVGGGSTNASDVTTGLSTSWQHAIEQSTIAELP